MKKILPLLILAIFIVVGVTLNRLNLFKSPPSQSQNETNPQKQKIKIGTIDIDPSIAFLVAKNKNLFAKYNLEVEDINVRLGSTEALVSGQVDIVITRPLAAITANLEGANIRWIGLLEKNFTYALYSRVPKEKIKTVGINKIGTPDHYHTIVLLNAAGIDSTKVNFVQTTDGRGKIIMLNDKTIDAAGLSIYYVLPAEKDVLTYDKLFTVNNQPGSEIPLTAFTTEKFLTSSPETAQNFLKALIEATFWAKKYSQETIEIITQAQKIDQDKAKIVYEEFLKNTQDLDFTPNSLILEPGLKAIAQVKENAGSSDIQSFVDPELIDKIKSAGFIDSVQKEN